MSIKDKQLINKIIVVLCCCVIITVITLSIIYIPYYKRSVDYSQGVIALTNGDSTYYIAPLRNLRLEQGQTYDIIYITPSNKETILTVTYRGVSQEIVDKIVFEKEGIYSIDVAIDYYLGDYYHYQYLVEVI